MADFCATAADSNILQLNDDCLHGIFTQLTIKEQLQLSKTCERFRWIVTQMIWKRQFQEARTVSTETDELSNEEYQELFHHIVEHMQKFTIADNQHLAFTSYLGRYTWRPELAFYLSFHFPRLTNFECLDRRLHDGLLRLVAENCPKLQVLRVSSDYITGAHIKDMRNLRELYLPKCTLSAQHLHDICQHLNLTHLDITGNAVPAAGLTEHSYSKLRYLKLSEASIDAEFVTKCGVLQNMQCLVVAELCREPHTNACWRGLLEKVGVKIASLKVFNASDASTMRVFAANHAYLPALHRLYVKADVPDRCLEAFAQLQGLEELQLYSYREFTPTAFVQFVSKSKCLRFVDLVCCENLFDLRLHWIFDIIDVLRAQGRHVPLALNIAHSELLYFKDFMDKIKLQVMEDYRFTGQSLLKLSFNVPPIRHEQSLDTFMEIHFK